MEYMSTTQVSPAIRYWLNKRTACTVHWTLADGTEKTAAGIADGWGVTSSGHQVLKIRRPGETVYAGAKPLQRWLDSQGVRTAPTKRCRECGAALGTGPSGYLDDYSAHPDFCYDCA